MGAAIPSVSSWFEIGNFKWHAGIHGRGLLLVSLKLNETMNSEYRSTTLPLLYIIYPSLEMRPFETISLSLMVLETTLPMTSFRMILHATAWPTDYSEPIRLMVQPIRMKIGLRLVKSDRYKRFNCQNNVLVVTRGSVGMEWLQSSQNWSSHVANVIYQTRVSHHNDVSEINKDEERTDYLRYFTLRWF